jgi:beta-lactamase regulating signal transducer with metallopeptidase domain
MTIPVGLWHSAISLLFVTIVSSTVMLSAALLLVPRVKALSASLRCRIWLLSLIACCLPAMMLASVPMFRAGGPYSQEVSAAVVATENVSENKTTELARPASEVNTFKVKSGEDFVETATEVVIAPDTTRGQNRAASVETVTSDHFNQIESAAIDTSASGTNATKPPTRFSWKIPMSVSRTVVITWLSISLFLMIRLLVNISRTAIVWGRRTQALLFAEQPHRRIASVLEGIGDNNAVVPIQISDAVMVPVVVGLFHPTIVLPAEVAQWPDGQLKLVLQHELAHVRRRDIFWNCFVSVVSAIIWFQPLAWIVQRKLRDDQEFACDDAVLLQGNEASEYAAMLVNVAESLLIRRQYPVSSVAMAGCCSVERRIHAILDTSTRRSETQRQKFTWITGMTIALLLLTVACCWLAPQLASAEKEIEPISSYAAISATVPVSPPIDRVVSKTNISEDEYRNKQRVIDESGKAVSGATVSVEGRNLSLSSVTTDANGWFEIVVPAASDSPSIIDTSLESGFVLRTVGPSGDKLCVTNYRQLTPQRRMELGRMELDRYLKDTPDIQLKPTCMQKVLVNDPEQQPVANAFVGVVMGRNLISLSKTDALGIAAVQRLPEGGQVFALKAGEGFDFCDLTSLNISVGETENISLTLEGARPITVRIVTPTEFGQRKPAGNSTPYLDIGRDDEFEKLEPVKDVRVVPKWLIRSNSNFETAMFLNSELAESLCPKTDAAGEATITWLPNWTSAIFQIDVAGNGLSSEQHAVEVKNKDEIHEIKIDRLVEIRGRVVDREGRPVAAAVIQSRRTNWNTASRIPYRETRTSDSEGHFSMFVLPRQELVIHAEMPGNISRSERYSIMPLRSPLSIELTFSGTNRISGTLTSGPNQTPLPGRVFKFYEMNRPDEVFPKDIAAQNADLMRQVAIDFKIQTDEHGRYDLQLGDGEWYISDPFQSQKNVSFRVNGGFQVQKDFHSDDMTLLRTRVISAETHEEVDGVVYISGVTQPQLNAGHHLVSRNPHMVEVSSSAGKAFTVWDGQSDEMQIFVAPVATASGQLVDDNGTPLPARSIRYMILPSLPAGTQRTKEFSYGNSGQIETDEHGKFTLSNFIQGCECQVMATNDEGIEWAKQRWTVLKAVVPTTDDPIDLGRLTISSSMPAE